MKQNFLTCKVGEYGVILNARQEVLVLRLPKSRRFPKEMWILPGGRLNKTDQAGAALVREVKEETGITVKALAPCSVVRAGYSKPEKYCVFFLCRVKGMPKIRLSDEHQAFRWMRFSELAHISWYHRGNRQAVRQAGLLIKKGF